MISHLVIGTALVLGTAAFVLALWPAVGDAPWEHEQIVIKEIETKPQPTKDELCLRFALLENEAYRRGRGFKFIVEEGKKIGCWD